MRPPLRWGLALCAAAAAQVAQAAPDAVEARYRVSVETPAGAKPVLREWVFLRTPDRIALVRGDDEEVWHRDADGSVRLERVLHREQRTIDYSAGELAALGVRADWQALGRLADRAQARWAATPDLPARVSLRSADGTRVKLVLMRWKPVPATAPAQSRGADYLRLDAADFGDMGYEPAVRRAEMLDMLAGWRTPHARE